MYMKCHGYFLTSSHNSATELNFGFARRLMETVKSWWRRTDGWAYTTLVTRQAPAKSRRKCARCRMQRRIFVSVLYDIYRNSAANTL